MHPTQVGEHPVRVFILGPELPYQLSGAPGRFTGSEDLLERSIQQASPAVTADLESRVMKDRSDWMLKKSVFRQILTRFPSLNVDLSFDRSASEVLQLETRPFSGSNRCVSPGPVRLCQSALEPDRESPLEGGGATSGCDTGSSSVANPTLVSQATGGGPMQDQPSTRSDMGSSGGVPPRAPPPASRVAYLRQHYMLTFWRGFRPPPLLLETEVSTVI